MPATFVFVHGGFGSAAGLAPTVPYLEVLGHRVINVDLPCERANATLVDYATTVVRAMEGTARPRILVGHSAGGATIPLAAAMLPVDRMVFVAAFVPEPGVPLYETVGPDVRDAINAISVDNGDGTRSLDFDLLASQVPPGDRDVYLEFLRATVRSQGWLAVTQPWPGAGIPDMPRSYVVCTEDLLVPPALQRAFAVRLGVEPIEIASGHEAFNIAPKELAQALATLAD